MSTPAALRRGIWRSTSRCSFRGHAEKVEDRGKDQIEYFNEDPWVRRKFEDELAKRQLTSLMPAEAYQDPNFEWSRGMGKQ